MPAFKYDGLQVLQWKKYKSHLTSYSATVLIVLKQAGQFRRSRLKATLPYLTCFYVGFLLSPIPSRKV